ncbi:hypothetical protein DFH06DRAFT_751317 [Mycena polygramma]|nr:hypothetical protein DFH06DRAFT_751317 [Mycena polygramma]
MNQRDLRRCSGRSSQATSWAKFKYPLVVNGQLMETRRGDDKTLWQLRLQFDVDQTWHAKIHYNNPRHPSLVTCPGWINIVSTLKQHLCTCEEYSHTSRASLYLDSGTLHTAPRRSYSKLDDDRKQMECKPRVALRIAANQILRRCPLAPSNPPSFAGWGVHVRGLFATGAAAAHGRVDIGTSEVYLSLSAADGDVVWVRLVFLASSFPRAHNARRIVARDMGGDARTRTDRAYG